MLVITQDVSATAAEETAHTASTPQVPNNGQNFTADEIASGNQDIVALADMFVTMKKALLSMTGSLEQLGNQSERMVSFALDVKAADQLKRLRFALDEQIEKQKEEVEGIRLALESKIKLEVEGRIRDQLRETVNVFVRERVQEKVQEELAKQIPDGLRQQVMDHQRQILEVKTTLHNSEARRYNSLTITGKNAPIRPLLRPLPTPEQSPVVPPISRSTSVDNNSVLPTPTSAYPHVPAPTPIRRATSNPAREPPTVSALFPPDLRTLFAMDPDQTRQLLRDYGLVSESPTPVIEMPPKPKALPDIDEEPSSTRDKVDPPGENEEAHVADMNKFMAHIGLPFLMIPAPKAHEDSTARMSSRTRRKRLLTPLIIK